MERRFKAFFNYDGTMGIRVLKLTGKGYRHLCLLQPSGRWKKVAMFWDEDMAEETMDYIAKVFEVSQ